jgi:hypothetical protein
MAGRYQLAARFCFLCCGKAARRQRTGLGKTLEPVFQLVEHRRSRHQTIEHLRDCAGVIVPGVAVETIPGEGAIPHRAWNKASRSLGGGRYCSLHNLSAK